MHDSAVGSLDGELVKQCLDEYMRGFQERNKNFHVFNAVMHLDEATPHLHIDYVPVAHGYKKSLDTQNGHAKALEQMGFGTGKEAINNWRLAEREILKNICNSKGIEIAEPVSTDRNSLTVEEYKAIADMAVEHGREQIETERIQHEQELERIKESAEQEKKEVEGLRSEKAELTASQKELKEETKAVADKLARAKTINKFRGAKGVEQKQYGAVGQKGVFIPDVTLQDVEYVAEAAQRREIGVSNAEKRAATAEQEVKDTLELAERRVAAAYEDTRTKIAAAQSEVATHKATAVKAADQWAEVLDILIQRGYNIGGKQPTFEDIPGALKWYAEKRAEYKAIADTVPQLKSQIEQSKSAVKRAENAESALRKTENALIKAVDTFTFTPQGDKIMVGSDFTAFVKAIKTEKPEHRVLERVMERDRELQRMLNKGLVR